MKPLVKLLIGLAAGFVFLLVAIVVIGALSINGIAKKIIEDGGTYALGVPTTVDSASVGLLSGKFSMTGFEVANPQGFTDALFLSLGEGAVELNTGSLGQDVIQLPLLRLDTIAANLEKKGGQSNYKIILDNLKKLGGSGAGDKPADPTGDEKKLVIQELVIRNVVVKVDMLGLPTIPGMESGPGAPLQKLTTVTIPIDEIKLSNVGRTGEGVAGSGVTLGELTGIIVQAVMAAAIQKGGDVIPAELLNDLRGSLSGLTDLSSLGFEALGGAPAQVQKLTEDIGKAAEDVLEEGAKKVEEGLKGLIPGQKP